MTLFMEMKTWICKSSVTNDLSKLRQKIFLILDRRGEVWRTVTESKRYGPQYYHLKIARKGQRQKMDLGHIKTSDHTKRGILGVDSLFRPIVSTYFTVTVNSFKINFVTQTIKVTANLFHYL